MPTVLSIQSLATASRVGNSAAMFALERLGIDVLMMPTTLYARHPGWGRPGGQAVAAETLADMLDVLESHDALKGVDAVISGYLPAPEHAAFVREAVARTKRASPQAIYVCDPVMGDAPGGLYVAEDTAHAICDALVPIADLVCPNAWEGGHLTGRSIQDAASAMEVARLLGRPSLISSVPHGERLGVLYCENAGAAIASVPRRERAPQGVGDLLTALFVGHCLLGRPTIESLSLSLAALTDIIHRSGAELAIVAGQHRLTDPLTRPTVERFERAL